LLAPGDSVLCEDVIFSLDLSQLASLCVVFIHFTLCWLLRWW